MKILILKPEMFASYGETMGLCLFKNALCTWFFDGQDLPVQLLTKEMYFPSTREIQEELEENDELLELAVLHDAVEVQDRDDNDYLNYCLSYE